MRRFAPLLLMAGIIGCQDITPPRADLRPAFAATASGNPFVGSWENIDPLDGSHQHMTVGSGPNMPVQYRDDGATACVAAGFGFVPATLKGFGVITSEDPFTFQFTADAYCHPRGPGGPQLVIDDITLPFVYDAARDILSIEPGVDCWYRSGHPESCA